ncbi:hypothetical protein [Kitasatospora sp. NPDC088783]|uniref:hypothetical protein n=1 Tax=Kitasatospora sp. NPDC088783 TaxID=3364077 RepID=UPI00382A557D
MTHRTAMDAEQLAELAELAADVLHEVCPQAEAALGRHPARVLAPLAEAVARHGAAQRYAEELMAATRLKSAEFRQGAAMEIEPARELAELWVGCARGMLGDAPNYSETAVVMEAGLAGQGERFAFTLQRAGRLTPHEARIAAEERAGRLAGRLESIRALLPALSAHLPAELAGDLERLSAAPVEQ